MDKTPFESCSASAVERLGAEWRIDQSRRWQKGGINVRVLFDSNDRPLCRYSVGNDDGFESLAYHPSNQRILEELIQVAEQMGVCTVAVPR